MMDLFHINLKNKLHEIKGIRVISLLLTFILGFNCQANSQANTTLTMEQAIEMARSKSISAYKAKTTREDHYWEWRVFKANRRPQLALNGQIPEYFNTYQEVQQPDGLIRFQKVERNQASVDLSLTQKIPLSGATLSATSALKRVDNFTLNEKQYAGFPIILELQQPLNRYNELRWDSKIEPVKYQESQRLYIEETERIALNTTQLYFQILSAQKNHEMAQINYQNNDTLYQIALEKNKMGKTSYNDVLQLRLARVNAQKALSRSELDFRMAWLNFRTYVGITDNQEMELILPLEIKNPDIDISSALQQAWNNRGDALTFQRKKLEAEKMVAQARGETGFTASVKMSLGYSNTQSEVHQVYQDPLDQQTVSLTFSMPIADWGLSRSRRKMAEANLQLTNYTLEQEKTNFEKEIITLIEQFNMLAKQVEYNSEARQIASDRYRISIERYKLGNMDITGLMIASSENDLASQDYIIALRDYWEAYYMIRLLTLYDFNKNKIIQYE